MKEWLAHLEGVTDRFLDALSRHVPILLGALALLLVGWILARLLRSAGSRLIASVDNVLSRTPSSPQVPLRAHAWRPYLDVLLSLLFATVFLIFLAASTEALGLPVVTAWLTGLSNYLPRLLAAGLILIMGIIGGRLARSATAAACASAQMAYGEQVAQLAQGAVLLVTVMVVAGQIGVDVTFLTVIAAVAAGSVLGGAAMAFGLGARDVVANILACHYISKAYKPGQVIKIGGLEGRILEIAATSVMLDTDDGKVRVPASKFEREISILAKAEE